VRVGLTGGIGSGKSEVGKIFAGLGALVIDADELAREALAPGSAGLVRIAERWPQVLRGDGELDRAALAAIIFADANAREFVNGIAHPFVRERSAALEGSARPGQIVVHDVPLLFEVGFYKQCDANVLVVAPREQRIARVIARSGLSRAEVERRMDAQIDPERARMLADYTIENNGSLADLRDRATSCYRKLTLRQAQGDDSTSSG
jgi:dephospho-CoA kinase